MRAMRSIVQVIVDNAAIWGYPHERHIHSHFRQKFFISRKAIWTI